MLLSDTGVPPIVVPIRGTPKCDGKKLSVGEIDENPEPKENYTFITSFSGADTPIGFFKLKHSQAAFFVIVQDQDVALVDDLEYLPSCLI
jgi:hypothetical protein